MSTFAALFCLLPLLIAAQADDLKPFAGRVVGVTDGDTISVLRRAGDRNEEVTIRLDGIDAPERAQAFYQVSRAHLANLAQGQAVTVYPTELDRYSRVVARVLAGGADLSQQMVYAGLAWHYTEYSSDEILAALQRDARAAPRGMWVDPSNRAPWEYRAAQRSRPAAERQPTAPSSRLQRSGTTYHGNTSSKVFHAPWCQHYNCKNCTRVFRSRQEAIAAGYKPGGICKP